MRVTEDELLLVAHFGLRRRLSEVVAASLTYQRDKRTHDRCRAEAAESEAVVATARRLSARLPLALGLHGLAESQHLRARRDLERAAARLRTSAETFVETAGDAAPDVIAAMDEHGWSLDRPSLLEALRTRAGLGAAS